MTDLLIRQMPEEMHRQLKARARANRRSTNQEILFLLESSLRVEASAPRSIPQPVTGAFPIDDSWLQQARDEGRS